MKRTNKSKLLIKIGFVSLVLSPIVFFSIPIFFIDIICNPNSPNNNCGFANAGIIGYMLYFSLPFFILGSALLAIAAFSKNKST